MTVDGRRRKLALTAHVGASLGWLGAVVSSLALSVAGLVSQDPQTVRGAYLSLELLGWYVLVPLSVASLLTGLVSSLTTPWGLLRHYWVVAKLVINVVATAVLLLYMQSLDHLARRAGQAPAGADPEALRSSSPVLHAGVALLLLLLATVLGVHKPRSVARYGWRKAQHRRAALLPQA